MTDAVKADELDVTVIVEGGVIELSGVLVRDLAVLQGMQKQPRDAHREVGNIIQRIGQKVRKQWSRPREQPDGCGERVGHDGIKQTRHSGVGDDAGDIVGLRGEREGGERAEGHAVHEERGGGVHPLRDPRMREERVAAKRTLRGPAGRAGEAGVVHGDDVRAEVRGEQGDQADARGREGARAQRAVEEEDDALGGARERGGEGRGGGGEGRAGREHVPAGEMLDADGARVVRDVRQRWARGGWRADEGEVDEETL